MEIKTEKEKTQTPQKNEVAPHLSQWTAFNKLLSAYTWACFFLSLTGLALAGLLFVQSYADPVVVVSHGGKRSFHHGHREKVELTREDMTGFISEFIARRYEWPLFSPKTIVHDLRDLGTPQFLEKLLEVLTREEKGVPQDKKLSQAIAGLQIEVQKEQILASFDRVLRLGELPLVAPTLARIQLKKGRIGPANPWGVYVDQFIEEASP